MTEDIFRKRPILGNRILTPIRDNVSETRPVVETKSPSPQTNSNLEISGNNQNSNKQDTINMNNNMSSDLSKLQDLINSGSQPSPSEEVATPVPQEPVATLTPVTPTRSSQPTQASVGNSFFRFPAVRPPFGGNIHSLSWTANKYDFIEAAGSTSDYVRFNNWHLHGVTVWIGTSATGAVEKVGIDPCFWCHWAYSASYQADR